jgi:hypothetical protein
MKRLQDVVARARVEPLEDAGDVGASGDEEDGDRLRTMVPTESTANVESRHLWHCHVTHYNVRLELASSFDSFSTVLECVNSVACSKHCRDEVSQFSVVLNDKR